MKKYCLLLLLLVSTGTFAQFKLSGKIVGYTGKTDLSINIPAVYGFFEQDLLKVPINKNGAFAVTLPVKGQKFAYVMFQGSVYPLLANKGKSLDIQLNTSTSGLKIISGNAQPENDLLQKINLAESPVFLQDDRFTHMDYNTLSNQLLKPYLAARDRKIAQVNQSAVSPDDKKLIIAEIRYSAYNNLHELTDVGAENPAVLNKFVADIYQKADIKPQIMPGGPQYYAFVNNYLIEAEKRRSVKPASLLTRWESALKYLPAPVAEQFGYQLILRAFYNHDTPTLKQLSSAYLKKFAAGMYAADVKAKAAKLK